MKKPIALFTLAACGSLHAGVSAIDGILDPGQSLRAVQTIETGFGDNASEWNAAYGDLTASTLDLMFTGNLEANFNKLEIFIDTVPGGSNVYNYTGAFDDGAGIMNAKGTGTGATFANFDETDVVFMVGGGVQYHVTDSWSFYSDARYNRPISGVSDYRHAEVGVGIMYKFVGEE